MSRLSKKEHWDHIHTGEGGMLLRSTALPHHESQGRTKTATGVVKRLIGREALRRIAAYDDYLLWETIFPHHLPDLNGLKVLEVGSAPGHFLVQFSRQYGCDPYGLDYSEVGVEVNKKVFIQNGIDPGHVICADFFSDDFQRAYKEQFDVVVSRGFIEHFDDVGPVLERHIHLLRRGGYLIVSVPNLRGVNYPLARLFDGQAIPRHNIRIMQRQEFQRLFERRDLIPIFCDYYGMFSFYLFTSDGSVARASALKLGQKIQPLLNFAFRTVFGENPIESAWTSPHQLYIGRKN